MATFCNQATLSYRGGTVNSNITCGEILEVLSVSKTAVVDSYTPGSDITYAVNILNSGTCDFRNVTLTDDLGAYTFCGETRVPLDVIAGSVKVFADGVLQTFPSVTLGPKLVVSDLTVPAEGVTTVLYTARTNDFAAPEPDGEIQNTVVISAPRVEDVTAVESVSVLEAPNLQIIKSVYPNVVAENGQITYTFEIRNVGNIAADAADTVILHDTFTPVLRDLSVVYNGEAWTEGEDFTYNDCTGEFVSLPGAITVPAAAFTQNPATGAWQTEPGSVFLTITGTL